MKNIFEKSFARLFANWSFANWFVAGIKASLLLVLKVYRYGISPLGPPTCRFMPTCSTYASEAITSHGICKGLKLSCQRLCRCHPWSKADLFDPVPPP